MATIVVDKTKHEIEAKRVTLVFNQASGQTGYPGRKMISPEDSLDHFRELESIDPLVVRLFLVVFPDFDRPVTKDSLDECGAGFQQTAGLLDLSLRCIVDGVEFGWKYPESSMHPRHQANLADVVLLMTDRERLVRLAKETKK